MSKKTKDLVNQRASWSVYLKLLKSIVPYWLFFVIGIIGTVLAAGTDAAMLYGIKPLMDHWDSIVGHAQWWFAWLPLIVVGVLLVRGFANFLSSYFLSCVGRNIVRDFRQRIFAHLMHLPAGYYDKESSGKLLSTLIYNTEQVAGASTEALLTVMQEGMLLIWLLIVMFNLSWLLTLVFIATAPIISVIIRYCSKRLRHLSASVQISMGDITHVAEEGIENYKVVRVFGGEEYEKQKFFAVTNQNRQREMKVIATDSLGASLTQIVTAVPIAIIIFVATSPLFHNITIGAFGAFIATTLHLLTPLKRLTKINAVIQKGVAGAHSIFMLLDEEQEKDIGNQAIAHASGSIEYKNVSFSYVHTKKEVLHDISFKVEPGQNIALVGRSGSGKTTLVSLLPRFYDASDGEILLDGVNIQNYKLLDLRKQLSIVSQHLTLFNDTIARNITYGSLQNATDAKIMRAAEAAHVLDFIKNLPDGLNTMIGENGLLLSGGQRQRIAIARALLKDAPILILDEATSALDTESERYIQAALEALMKKRTTLVIAHRLSTVERADKIIVLNRGKILEVGTHKELLELNGQYAKLYKLQFKDHD
jgi:subfamily B ATP-binding cassette protein MsbA